MIPTLPHVYQLLSAKSAIPGTKAQSIISNAPKTISIKPRFFIVFIYFICYNILIKHKITTFSPNHETFYKEFHFFFIKYNVKASFALH